MDRGDIGTALAGLIDHTILAPDATSLQVSRFCEEALAYAFCSVCVNSRFVPLVTRLLHGSGVRCCAVVGFPLGAVASDIKAAEAAWACAEGAQEIDMVMAIGALKDADMQTVQRDIARVRAACPPAVLKVIIETCLLADEEKQMACLAAQHAGADFVKTSTGFSHSGATVHDVALMRAVVGPGMGVKASGGIRTRATAEAMIAAGATRIGASASLAIIQRSDISSSAY
jgi:deoxyribose-phosphate aldolase